MSYQRLGVGILAIGMMLGCAKDRTLDEWRSEQQQIELAKLKSAVEGVYPGELQSRSDGKTLGSIVFELEANYDSTQNDRASQQAIVNGQVTLISEGSTGRIAFSKAYFDSESGLFKASAQITQLSGEKADIALSGKIENHVFTGDIEVLGFKENGGHFNLKKSADLVGNVSGGGAGSAGKATGGGAEGIPLSQTFAGEGVYTSGKKRPTQLTLTHPHFTKEQEFVETLSGIRTFRASILFGELSQKDFPAAKWDLRMETLRAETQIDASALMQFECVPSGKGWNCRVFNTKSGLILTVDFQPVNLEAI